MRKTGKFLVRLWNDESGISSVEIRSGASAALKAVSGQVANLARL